jgi:2-polyprenyl-3-methyl-5-hydroxy-6-metoxy-1,4-benzoquinol methylase
MKGCMARSWDDNEAVGALSALAGSVDQLAGVAAERPGLLSDEGAADAKAELPLQDLPAHLQFARLWAERRHHYLPRARKRSCPVCGAGDGHPWFRTQDGYAYVFCPQCSMVYIPEVLSMETWDAYFAELPHAREWLATQMAATLSGATDEHNQRRFGRYFDLLHTLGAIRPGARLLDIGTFTGASLQVARQRGLEAFGIEGLQEAVRFVNERRPDRRVALGHAETFARDVHGGQFALVTMWETLEHTFSPADALARAHDALAPGGWIAITVPNASNVQFSVLREYCYFAYGGYEGVGHVNLFTPDTLAALLDRQGFEVVHTETEFGTDWRQIAYYLQHRFARIHCYENLIRHGDIGRQPEGGFAILLNWLSPALTRLENAWLAGPIVVMVARRR